MNYGKIWMMAHVKTPTNTFESKELYYNKQCYSVYTYSDNQTWTGCITNKIILIKSTSKVQFIFNYEHTLVNAWTQRIYVIWSLQRQIHMNSVATSLYLSFITKKKSKQLRFLPQTVFFLFPTPLPHSFWQNTKNDIKRSISLATINLLYLSTK